MKRSGQVKPSNVMSERRRTVLGADEIGARMRGDAGRPAKLDADRVRRLRHVEHLVIEQDLDARTFAETLENKLCGLELLALHDERMARVVFENDVVELRDERCARPIPKLKDRRHQADARHVVGEAVFGQEIECRRMRRGGARIGLQAASVVEKPDRQAAAAEQRTAKQPDRAAGDQDSSMIRTHSQSLPDRSNARDRARKKPSDRAVHAHRFLDRSRTGSEERRPSTHRDNR